MDETGQWMTYGTKYQKMQTPRSYPINNSYSTFEWTSLKTYDQGGFYNPQDVRDLLELLHRNARVETVNAILTDHTQLSQGGGLTLDSDISGVILDRYTGFFMKIFKTIQKIGNFVSSLFGFYIIIMAIKFLFNRIVDFTTFRQILSAPMMCLTLLCPAIARYRKPS